MPAVVERRQQLTGPDLRAAGALERWFGAAGWGLAIVDPRHRVVRANPALAEMDGVPLDEHAGRPVEDLIPGLAEQIAPILRRVLEDCETVAAAELVERDDRWVTSWVPLRDDDGTVQPATGMLLRRSAGPAKCALDLRALERRMQPLMEGTGTDFW